MMIIKISVKYHKLNKHHRSLSNTIYGKERLPSILHDDYCNFNTIIIKKEYPFHLIKEFMDHFLAAEIHFKLDIHNIHHCDHTFEGHTCTGNCFSNKV